MFIASLWLGLSMASTMDIAYGAGTHSCKPLEFHEIATDTKTVLVVVDQRVELACEVKTGQKDFAILWQKDGQRLCHGKRVRVKRRGQYLKIAGARGDDAGNYSCEVFRKDLSCGKSPTLKKTFRLVVTEEVTRFVTNEGSRPSFMIDTARRFVAIPVGSSIKLDCSTKGSPPLAVKWSKDGLPASKRYKRIRQFQLKIGTAVPRDTGNYTCNVSNGYGWIKHTYQLYVKERLRAKPIVLPLSNATAWAGEDIELMCWALSDVMPYFQWLQWFPAESTTAAKYNVLGEDSEEFVVKPVPTVMRSGAFEFTGIKLILLNVSTQQQGRYSCVVGNAVGFTVKDVHVTVLEKKGSKADCFGAADGYYPHANNCSAFVVCKDGVSQEEGCPSALLWNKRQNFCDLPKNVSC